MFVPFSRRSAFHLWCASEGKWPLCTGHPPADALQSQTSQTVVLSCLVDPDCCCCSSCCHCSFHAACSLVSKRCSLHYFWNHRSAPTVNNNVCQKKECLILKSSLQYLSKTFYSTGILTYPFSENGSFRQGNRVTIPNA